MATEKNTEILRAGSKKIQEVFKELQNLDKVVTKKDFCELIRKNWATTNKKIKPISISAFNKYFNFLNKPTYESALDERTMQIVLKTIDLILSQNQTEENISFQSVKTVEKNPQYKRLINYVGCYYSYFEIPDISQRTIVRNVSRIFEKQGTVFCEEKSDHYAYESYNIELIGNSKLYIESKNLTGFEEKTSLILDVEIESKPEVLYGVMAALTSENRPYVFKYLMIRQNKNYNSLDEMKSIEIGFDEKPENADDQLALDFFKNASNDNYIFTESILNRKKLLEIINSSKVFQNYDQILGTYLDFFFDYDEDKLEWNVYELLPNGQFKRKDSYNQDFEGHWTITGKGMSLRIINKEKGSDRYFDTIFKIDNIKKPEYLSGFFIGLHHHYKIKFGVDVMVRVTNLVYEEVEPNIVVKDTEDYKKIISEYPKLEKYLFEYSEDIFSKSSIALINKGK